MSISHQEHIQQAIALAEQWQIRANELLTREEKRQQEQMKRLLTHPKDKVLLSRLIDQSFRSRNPKRVADQMASLLRQEGMPEFFSGVEKVGLRMFVGLGRHFSSLTVPRLIGQMRSGSSRAIIPGEHEALQRHLHKRYGQGVRMNINHLGEAVLGEQEAAHRKTAYIKDMEDPDIEYISIKISTIYSQISSLAFDETVATLRERLSAIYRSAKNNTFTRTNGEKVPKFVNLDMEEYRDLEITYEAFVSTLDQEEFFDLAAGIVLQAYLPDSFAMQKKLTVWARERVAGGGAPVKLRIVKGANMEMEKLESALNNWPLATYDNKLEVDANYKRMVRFGMEPDNIAAVRLGIASHNLFELAYAAVLARENGVCGHFGIEMLEGMADHVCRALQEGAGDLLLYAPVASQDEFINAIGYLIRRLDENTAAENFLRYSPDLQPGSSEWQLLKEGFVRSCEYIEQAQDGPNRIQDRNNERFSPAVSTLRRPEFINEADTDWSLAANRRWAEGIRARWMKTAADTPLEIPVVINGEELFSGRTVKECLDPNQPGAAVVVARYALASAADAELALQTARDDPDGWRRLNAGERHAILAQAAMNLRAARADLIGAMAASTGKVFTEADPEVSEAIDFAEFYPHALAQFAAMPNLELRGRGVGLVISPWNFPVAIPCGGISAALAAGNTVIFKPSSDAVLSAWQLCQCFWQAGVSRKALQFVPCSGAEVGPRLTTSPLVDFIILTGGTETGLQILKDKPGVYLAAETGGKNATIVTDMADRDQAIKNVLHSAFSNCGQKCSATSLLILEASIYDDPHFRQQLADAVASLQVGSAWKLNNRMGALIKPPSGALERALTTLEPGEEWVVRPAMVDGNPNIWSPGVKYGVRPGSYTHMTEFFGPVLGVMRATDLDEAVRFVNQTGYGLTSGLESLDSREQERWKETIFAGNLYINRGTTGAIVLRQPFGGMGKSAFGPGLKAGSLEYVTQFMEIREIAPPPAGVLPANHRLLQLAREWRLLLQWGKLQDCKEEWEKSIRAIASCVFRAQTFYQVEQDYFHLRGQDNLLRYLPVERICVRLHADDSLFETITRICAALIAGCKTTVSVPPALNNQVTAFLEGRHGRELRQMVELWRESDEELAARMASAGRLRYAAPERVPQGIYEAAAKTGAYIARTPVYMEGRLELLQYFRQQAICVNYHRYGNLGERSQEFD